MKKYLTIALALSLAACGGHVEFPKPPADKLECPNEPFAPEGEITDEKNGEYLKALRASWYGCFTDVVWMRDWFARLVRR